MKTSGPVCLSLALGLEDLVPDRECGGVVAFEMGVVGAVVFIGSIKRDQPEEPGRLDTGVDDQLMECSGDQVPTPRPERDTLHQQYRQQRTQDPEEPLNGMGVDVFRGHRSLILVVNDVDCPVQELALVNQAVEEIEIEVVDDEQYRYLQSDLHR